MTLIVSVVAPDFVFQVSDRRVTLLHQDGRRTVREEPLTKAVMFCDRAILGFTGYAEVDVKRTDLWIAEQLKDVEDLGEGFDKMRSRLTEVFRRPRYRLGHTITAAGFKLETDGSASPYYAMVTNQFQDGRWVERPLDRFYWVTEMAPANAIGVFAAPGWIVGDRLLRLRREVSQASSLEEAIGTVAASVREVAAQHDEVGADLLLSVLPKTSVGRSQIFLLTGGPPGETPTFHRLPVDKDPIHHGPTFVCNGAIVSGIEAGPIAKSDRAKSAQATREFHRANRPQRAYLIPVRTTYDESHGGLSRAPDAGDVQLSGTFCYHPSEDIALVLTKATLDGFAELTTLEELEDLRAAWGGGFNVSNVSEVTGIGWVE